MPITAGLYCKGVEWVTYAYKFKVNLKEEFHSLMKLELLKEETLSLPYTL